MTNKLFSNIKFTGMAVSLTMALMTSPAVADPGFKKWIRDFRGVAAKNGVRTSTYDAVFFRHNFSRSRGYQVSKLPTRI